MQSLNSFNGRTSYRKVLWSLKATWFGFRLFQYLRNMTDTSAAQLPKMAVKCQSDTIIIATNVAASGLQEILWQNVDRLVNKCPDAAVRSRIEWCMLRNHICVQKWWVGSSVSFRVTVTFEAVQTQSYINLSWNELSQLGDVWLGIFSINNTVGHVLTSLWFLFNP